MPYCCTISSHRSRRTTDLTDRIILVLVGSRDGTLRNGIPVSRLGQHCTVFLQHIACKPCVCCLPESCLLLTPLVTLLAQFEPLANCPNAFVVTADDSGFVYSASWLGAIRANMADQLYFVDKTQYFNMLSSKTYFQADSWIFQVAGAQVPLLRILDEGAPAYFIFEPILSRQ